MRNREPSWFTSSDYVIDVGDIYVPKEHRYDHHNPSFDIKYPDGSLYASAGLVWINYSQQVLDNSIT